MVEAIIGFGMKLETSPLWDGWTNSTRKVSKIDLAVREKIYDRDY